jgi:hypothetical protein
MPSHDVASREAIETQMDTLVAGSRGHKGGIGCSAPFSACFSASRIERTI